MHNQNWRSFSRVIAIAAVTALILIFSTFAGAQMVPGSRQLPATAPAGPHNWITPPSSIARPGDAGVRAHTNWVFGASNGKVVEAGTTGVSPDVTIVQHYETPSSMACLYKITPHTGPCVPNFNSPGGVTNGGWGAIALVDAYDNPYAAA